MTSPTTFQIPHPDVIGEFDSPLDGALYMASRGIPQTPLRAGTKIAVLSGWEQSASTDFEVIRGWAASYFNCNFASVSREDSPTFTFETDSIEVVKRFEVATGGKFTSAFKVSSSRGKGHRYYARFDGVENIAQNATTHGDFSVRATNAYCVSPGSIHPTTGVQYSIIESGEFTQPTAEEISFWYSEKKSDIQKSASLDTGTPIAEGGRNSTLTSLAGKARQILGMNEEELLAYLLRVNTERCVPPLPESEVRTIAGSIARYEVKDERVLRNGVPMGTPDIAPVKTIEEVASEIAQKDVVSDAVVKQPLDEIPEFDNSVVTGIFKDVVDLATTGTTMPRQFAFLAAKVFAGARLSTHMTFEGVDGDSAYYATVIGQTGTGKALAWRRTIDKILAPKHVPDKGVKIFYDVDSGAGLRDSFFEPPKEYPALLFIDEVTALGHKAGERKNPEIVDTLVTLASSNTVTRMKAKKGNGKDAQKTHDAAHLSVYMCGQDGEAYMGSFPGKTKVGLWDRFYPEFSNSVEAGYLPDIDPSEAGKLLVRFYSLPTRGQMTMDEDTRESVEMYWKYRPIEVRQKVRFKVYLMLDMYLNAWANGRMQANIEDFDIAVRIFERQLVIRRQHFTGEIPDRVGYFIGLLKKVVEGQRYSLRHGGTPKSAAMSLRDYQTDTNAFRDSELQTFTTAWRNFAEAHLVKVFTKAKNGQMYEKYLPMPYEDEMWLPEAQELVVRGRTGWYIVV